MDIKAWLGVARGFLICAIPLFAGAGTLAWPAGWAFLVQMFGPSLLMMQTLARRDPALLAERLKPAIQKDQPLWDRAFMILLMAAWPAWLVLMGVDAMRFRWSAMPVWLQFIGAAGILLAMAGWYFVFRENTFLAPVVKIQKERGHRVVSTGPYAIVRHPMYAAALLFFVATALELGSWYGLLGAAVLSGLLILRTVLEDRELKRGLPGYAAYAERVRYRLVPLIW